MHTSKNICIKKKNIYIYIYIYIILYIYTLYTCELLDLTKALYTCLLMTSNRKSGDLQRHSCWPSLRLRLTVLMRSITEGGNLRTGPLGEGGGEIEGGREGGRGREGTLRALLFART